MNSSDVRNTFLEFFRSKQHKVVPSASMAIKNDPTLMFTNAGMNQFKEFFLGHAKVTEKRVANSQKCLRVAGKHNDLEEVGHDTYHHTMFEMLGNWSFGDYFKKEAITWAWELLTEVYGIKPDSLYATVFGGDKKDKTGIDEEAYEYWKAFLPEERILYGNKKDNFWEMGDAGPCGPCSEVHVDIRSEEEKQKTPGKDLVNKDHPQVIEIWNLVFIEFNRKADGSLQNLPQKHIDTGMGFERLCMVLQGTQSNYDTDVFQPIIQTITRLTSVEYGSGKNTDIALRVIADHLRAVTFAIADGQLPSNVKAGYVIRRILRRAVRYAYTFLNVKDPFMYKLFPVLNDQMGEAFPELNKQKDLIIKVIREEEAAFLRTLENGIQKFEQYLRKHPNDKVIDGEFVFELFDTYGFPVDLTQLMAREKNLDIDMEGFNKGLEKQKNRSRNAASMNTGDWVEIYTDDREEFIGYDHLETSVKITKYREVLAKNKHFYQLVFNVTPFYAESGGQVGDTGCLISGDEKIRIFNTQKENNLIIHYADKLPEKPEQEYFAEIDKVKRRLTTANHTATHLLHHALREILGKHVEQKGSLVEAERLRFDFSHFQKLSDEETRKIEKYVNHHIRQNLPLKEKRAIPMNEAEEMGAIAFFGEKYGDLVRVIKFGDSIELCGGNHVQATGELGFFKIISESAIAAGIRRIEAVTADKAEQYIYEQDTLIREIKEMLKAPKKLTAGIQHLIEQKNQLEKEVEKMKKEKAGSMQDTILGAGKDINGIHFIAMKVDLDSQTIKNLAFALKDKLENMFLLLGNENNGNAGLSLMISPKLAENKQLHAGNMIREIAKEIQGGGGGQPHFATAGGKNIRGLEKAFQKAEAMIKKENIRKA